MRKPAPAPGALAQAGAHDGAAGAPAGVRVPRTCLVMLAAAGGLGLGALFLYFDYGSWSRQARDYARAGPFLLWVALTCAQTMPWALALPPLAGTFRRRWRARTPASALKEAVPSAVVLAFLGAAVAVVPR
jgi:hypothetical protein